MEIKFLSSVEPVAKIAAYCRVFKQSKNRLPSCIHVTRKQFDDIHRLALARVTPIEALQDDDTLTFDGVPLVRV